MPAARAWIADQRRQAAAATVGDTVDPEEFSDRLMRTVSVITAAVGAAFLGVTIAEALWA